MRNKLALALVFGVAVVLALALFGNVGSLLQALRHFDWKLVPLILALTLVNYGLRFVKWHFYLVQIGVTVDLGDSFAIFSSGLCMAITPGKVGEMLKPVLLRMRAGTPLSKSAPVVMAERLTDGIAMILLAAAGLALSQIGWQVLVPAIALSVVLMGALGTAAGERAVLALAGRAPVLGSRLGHVQAFVQSSRALFTPKNILLAVGLGVVSWGAEACAFYLVLTGLGLPGSFLLFVQCTFVLATSTLVGSLSLLPGGLGAAEASVTGLLLLVVRVGRAKAAAATLLIRFCTLWFGVTLGLIALFAFRNRFVVRPAAPFDTEPEQHAPRAAVNP